MDRAWTAVDLFAGCGGLSTGLKQAGFQIVSAVELDGLAAATYEVNHPEVYILEADIADVVRSDLKGPDDVKIDLVAGCPPCQGFSRVRRRNRRRPIRDKRNSLVDQFERIVRSLRPSAVFLENVPGIEKYSRFKQFLSFLRREGYMPECEILDLSEYGVPQRRRRVCVLAGRGFKIEMPKLARNQPTVRSSIAALPVPGKSRNPLHQLVTSHAPEVLRRIKAVPKDGGSRSDWPDELKLECHKTFDGFKDVYGRMSWDAPAPTITGGCVNASKGRFLHPKYDRVITLFEAAILQGFPRSYKFPTECGKYPVAEMIGNALPPEFARRVAVQVIRALQQQSDD